jgi:DNA-binding transcriptional regulator YdaS (Cro superfamily)
VPAYRNKLADWAAESGRSRRSIALELGISKSYCSQLMQVQPPWPSREVAQAIERMTGGEVTVESFVHLKPMPRGRRKEAA